MKTGRLKLKCFILLHSNPRTFTAILYTSGSNKNSAHTYMYNERYDELLEVVSYGKGKELMAERKECEET